ncbi:Os03g0683401 [Oryza sativa Japonica Group]|uniref:Os03g0683401 protein n=1 Tax=Oryza sativa subsp. japonica TaxID=39947 RepID=A0A0P0W264_ORYSJ|nr:Os03g0683401 [Oryza sativa Japonica Group]
MVDNGDDNDEAAIRARILSHASGGGRAADCSEAALQPPASARRPAAILRSPRPSAPLTPASAPFLDADKLPSGGRCAGRRAAGHGCADAALCAASATRRPTA